MSGLPAQLLLYLLIEHWRFVARYQGQGEGQCIDFDWNVPCTIEILCTGFKLRKPSLSYFYNSNATASIDLAISVTFLMKSSVDCLVGL